jgi:hypothetical protein
MSNDIPCPCSKCVVFTICNANNEYIHCSLLYNYFIDGGVNTEHINGCDYYTSPQSDRLKAIEDIFSRRIRNWEYIGDPLPNDTHRELQIVWAREEVYRKQLQSTWI